MGLHRDRQHLILGAHSQEIDMAAYREWLAGILPEVAPSLEERVVWLTGELVRSHRAHLETARMAWNLYLAGTGKESETLAGMGRDPVEDVRRAVAAVAAGLLTPATETRNVSDDTPPTEETP